MRQRNPGLVRRRQSGTKRRIVGQPLRLRGLGVLGIQKAIDICGVMMNMQHICRPDVYGCIGCIIDHIGYDPFHVHNYPVSIGIFLNNH